MVAVPADRMVTLPFLSTVATFSLSLLQATLLSVALDGVTLALNWMVSPTSPELLPLMETLVVAVPLACLIQLGVPDVLDPVFPEPELLFPPVDGVVFPELLLPPVEGLAVPEPDPVFPVDGLVLLLLFPVDGFVVPPVDGLLLFAGAFLTVTLQVAFFLEPSFVVTVMVAVPAFFPVTTPLEEIAATLFLDVFQDTDLLEVLDGATVGFRVYFFPIYTVKVFLLRVTFFAFTAFTVTLQEYFFFPALAVIVAFPAFLP